MDKGSVFWTILRTILNQTKNPHVRPGPLVSLILTVVNVVVVQHNIGFGLQKGVVLELNQPERKNKNGVVLELNPS